MTKPLRADLAGLVAGALAVCLAGLLLAIPMSPPASETFAQRVTKKPAKTQPAKDEPSPITDDVDDPAVWGKLFPLQYELYLKTVDMHAHQVRRQRGLPHTPTQADPRSVVSRSPRSRRTSG